MSEESAAEVWKNAANTAKTKKDLLEASLKLRKLWKVEKVVRLLSGEDTEPMYLKTKVARDSGCYYLWENGVVEASSYVDFPARKEAYKAYSLPGCSPEDVK